MPAGESVISSLIPWDRLADTGPTAVELSRGRNSESLIVVRGPKGSAAYLNVCPHAGRRLDYVPGKFLIERGHLVCAAHGAMFRLEDGLCTAGPCRGESLRALPSLETAEGLRVELP